MSGEMKDKDQMSLEDKGWTAMQELLDKEMPTRRVVPLWWFGSAAAVALLLVVVGWIWYPKLIVNSMDGIELVELDSPQSGVRENEALVAESNPALENEVGDSDLRVSSELKDHVGESEGDLDSRSDRLSATFQADEHDVDQVRQGTESSLVDAEEPLKVEEALLSTDESSKVEEATMDVARSSEVTVEREQGDLSTVNVDVLEPVTFSPKVLPELNPVLEGLRVADFREEIVAIDIEKKWRWNVGIGASTTMSFQKPGLHAGLGVSYSLGRNVAIGMGVSYWRVPDNQDFSYLQEDSQLSDINRLDPQSFNADQLGNVSSLTNGTVYSGGTEVLSYLRVPVSVTLFPQKVFSPHLGVSMISLLSNKRSGLVKLDAASPNMPTSLRSERIPDLVRNTNFSLDMGFEVGLGKRLGLDLTYIHGFNSYINYEIGDGGVPELHRALWATFLVKF